MFLNVKKYIFLILNKVYPELDISDETIKISISVEGYDKRTAENYQNCYVAKKRIISKLFPNLQKLETWIKIVSTF